MVYKATVFSVQEWTFWKPTTTTTTGPSPGTNTTCAHQFRGGFVAGAVNAGLFVTPVELVRIQLIAVNLASASTTTATKKATTAMTTTQNKKLTTLHVINSTNGATPWSGWFVDRR